MRRTAHPAWLSAVHDTSAHRAACSRFGLARILDAPRRLDPLAVILDAPEGRRIEAIRIGCGAVSPHVALIDTPGRELVMSLDAAIETGACLIGAGAIAGELLDTVDIRALVVAAQLELQRQFVEARRAQDAETQRLLDQGYLAKVA